MAENCKSIGSLLPPYRYDTSNTLQIKADDFSLVRFDHNKYAVPYQYSSQDDNGQRKRQSGHNAVPVKIIAKYDRDYRHNQTHYRLEHYIGLIESVREVFTMLHRSRKLFRPNFISFWWNWAVPKKLSRCCGCTWISEMRYWNTCLMQIPTTRCMQEWSEVR